jgi:flavodoxin
MKNKLFIISIIIIGLLITACSNENNTDTELNIQDQTSQPNEIISEEPSTNIEIEEIEDTEINDEIVSDSDSSKVLIAYFTWADNTEVENPDEIDVDATTSASVLPPGNTGKLAGWIHEVTGGDVFQIITTEPYSSDYDECLDRAADEKAADARPQLIARVDNMDDYDVIFLGFPNWWYTAPMAVFSFIEEYDLSGKTIVPFVAHGTGGLSSTIRDITDKLPNSTILEPFGVYRPDVDTAQDDVEAWIDSHDIEY